MLMFEAMVINCLLQQALQVISYIPIIIGLTNHLDPSFPAAAAGA